ncbi:MAG: hypothetical protein RBR74_02410 [Ignavibacteriaceae bacterium]|nr:hypothetical protein [Ignavibacteriaceae bacterium]
MIYNEGIRPLLDINTIPEITDLENILEWFSVKFFYDIKKIKDSNKVEYKQFIDELVALSYVTLSTVGNIGIKYNVDFRNSVYEEEIKKIPAGSERETFKANFITDCVLGAEIRIMAWLYHDYFDEWFKPEKLKYE